MVSNSKLLKEFDATVGNAMGVFMPGSKGFLPSLSPMRAGLLILVAVLFFFSLPVWLLSSMCWAPIVHFSIWGAIYYGWASFCSRQATRILRSLVGEIDCLLSEEQKQYIIDTLRQRFDRKRVLLIAVIVVVLALLVSGYALIDAEIPGWILAVVLLEISLFYYTAAQATYVARFYGIFAEAIEKDSQTLSVLAPSQSPVIEVVHLVGKTVVLFWFGIVVAVLTLGIFYQHFRVFVLIVIPIASFFSLVFGSAVYLMTERILRRVSRQAAAKTQLRLDHEARALLEQTGHLEEATLKRLSSLSSLRAEVSATKSTQGIMIAVLSIVIPLASPAVALIIYFLKIYQ